MIKRLRHWLWTPTIGDLVYIPYYGGLGGLSGVIIRERQVPKLGMYVAALENTKAYKEYTVRIGVTGQELPGLRKGNLRRI